jgi:PAS domain S-box-containing protein
MSHSGTTYKSYEALEKELEELRHQLDEANDTIEAIRTGQIDALVVHGDKGHQLYTLKSADQTYRVFIEKMAEGAVTINPKGLVLYCNSQFARMVNLPLSNVIGIPFENFIHPENIGEYKKLFEKCWKNDCKGEVNILAGKDKTPVQLSLTTLELEEGVSLSIILTDLTSQKETQKQLKLNNEQLEATNNALEVSNNDLVQFASVASHDLQEPLRKIHFFSHLLQEKHKEFSPEAMKYLKKIIYSSVRMKSLIIDILSYSKLSAANHQVEEVDLNELVKELKDDFELLITEKGATINLEGLPVIEANKGQLRQVFQNIISNSLKFSKETMCPVINITANFLKEKSFISPAQNNGPFCMITVKDNGIGFDEKYLDKIFALFERLNTKDKFEGTGIGMAIAKKIIEKHNGLITAHSTEGEGAEFKIILPVKQVEEN